MPEQARSLDADNPPNWLQAAAEGSPMTQAAFEAARRASLAARSAAWLSEQVVWTYVLYVFYSRTRDLCTPAKETCALCARHSRVPCFTCPFNTMPAVY